MGKLNANRKKGAAKAAPKPAAKATSSNKKES